MTSIDLAVKVPQNSDSFKQKQDEWVIWMSPFVCNGRWGHGGGWLSRKSRRGTASSIMQIDSVLNDSCAVLFSGLFLGKLQSSFNGFIFNQADFFLFYTVLSLCFYRS